MGQLLVCETSTQDTSLHYPTGYILQLPFTQSCKKQLCITKKCAALTTIVTTMCTKALTHTPVKHVLKSVDLKVPCKTSCTKECRYLAVAHPPKTQYSTDSQRAFQCPPCWKNSAQCLCLKTHPFFFQGGGLNKEKMKAVESGEERTKVHPACTSAG